MVREPPCYELLSCHFSVFSLWYELSNNHLYFVQNTHHISGFYTDSNSSYVHNEVPNSLMKLMLIVFNHWNLVIMISLFCILSIISGYSPIITFPVSNNFWYSCKSLLLWMFCFFLLLIPFFFTGNFWRFVQNCESIWTSNVGNIKVHNQNINFMVLVKTSYKVLKRWCKI